MPSHHDAGLDCETAAGGTPDDAPVCHPALVELCPFCREAREMAGELHDIARRNCDFISVRVTVDCTECGNTGYRLTESGDLFYAAMRPYLLKLVEKALADALKAKAD